MQAPDRRRQGKPDPIWFWCFWTTYAFIVAAAVERCAA